MSKKVYYEPMNDTELANILDMDEAEILGAFGYDNEGCVQNGGFNMFPSNQNEDENRMDMDGTQLISDTELAALNGYDANLVYDVIDRDIAHGSGYDSTSQSSMCRCLVKLQILILQQPMAITMDLIQV